LFVRKPVDLQRVEPEDAGQARTLHRADALLAHPQIQALEHQRREELRDGFRRAGQRLAGR
jgi:hypothetical protein